MSDSWKTGLDHYTLSIASLFYVVHVNKIFPALGLEPVLKDLDQVRIVICLYISFMFLVRRFSNSPRRSAKATPVVEKVSEKKKEEAKVEEEVKPKSPKSTRSTRKSKVEEATVIPLVDETPAPRQRRSTRLR